jgi:flagellum-specific peptidoglycan hydrolase FlgJ
MIVIPQRAGARRNLLLLPLGLWHDFSLNLSHWIYAGVPIRVRPFSFGGTIMQTQTDFLISAWQAAKAAEHIWPDYAACETALESAWGASKLATVAHNLFGQKQTRPPLAGTGTLSLPTREFLRGKWVTESAVWVSFPDITACFRARMELLRRESAEYPHFAAALAAPTGEAFIRAVSLSWSTDPARADKVLAIHAAHAGIFIPSAG